MQKISFSSNFAFKSIRKSLGVEIAISLKCRQLNNFCFSKLRFSFMINFRISHTERSFTSHFQLTKLTKFCELSKEFILRERKRFSGHIDMSQNIFSATNNFINRLKDRSCFYLEDSEICSISSAIWLWFRCEQSFRLKFEDSIWLETKIIDKE